MSDLALTTPAIIFPAISLLLIAYTNRYIAISNRVRTLHAEYKEDKSNIVLAQIEILKKRILLIRNMQLFCILSMLTAALTIFLIYHGFVMMEAYCFSLSLLLLLTSLSMSAYEIILSNKALFILLIDIEHVLEEQGR